MSFKIRTNKQVGNATVLWGWCDAKVSVYLKLPRMVNWLISSVTEETEMFSCSSFASFNLHLFFTDQGLSITD